MDENKNDNITDVINDQKVANETSHPGIKFTIIVSCIVAIVDIIKVIISYDPYGSFSFLGIFWFIISLPIELVIIWGTYAFWLISRKEIGGLKSIALIALIICSLLIFRYIDYVHLMLSFLVYGLYSIPIFYLSIIYGIYSLIFMSKKYNKLRILVIISIIILIYADIMTLIYRLIV